MKIAMAVEHGEQLAGHAGQARRWLVYECLPGTQAAARAVAREVVLERAQVFHHWNDDGPHPLDGVEVIVARSAGDGFLRRMQARGVSVLLTAETDASSALDRVLAGEALADPRWDVSQLLCRIKDLFSRH